MFRREFQGLHSTLHSKVAKLGSVFGLAGSYKLDIAASLFLSAHKIDMAIKAQAEAGAVDLKKVREAVILCRQAVREFHTQY
jgi:hypothetical protein